MSDESNIVYCGKCGQEMGARPPRPGLSVCPNCLSAIDLENHVTDMFAIPRSDLELAPVVFDAVSAQRHRIRQMQAGGAANVVQAAELFGRGQRGSA